MDLKMTDNFPDLTEENVRYWYEECDPAWSGHDIANEVGCSIQTVYNFMRKKKIKIKSYSEAEKNANKCPHKYQAKHGMKFEEGSEWKEKQKASQLKNWEDNPKKRKKKSDQMKQIFSNKLSDYQKWILFVIYKLDKDITLREMVGITGLNKKIVNRQLYTLTNRRILECNTNEVNEYRITEFGKRILPKELKDKEYELSKIRLDLRKIRKINQKIYKR